ncbi:hypothetical protein Mapa_010768 [Marchantia paleacea]|nr:hypothetical protein Mapa_010768 [Marchantia paleacea]
MPGLTALKMSSHVPQAMGVRLEKRKDRTSAALRRPRRSRSFRNRSVRVVCDTRRTRDDIDIGKSSSGASSIFGSDSSHLMQIHGEKVRCLIKMIDQQSKHFEHGQMSPIQQLQVRRFRSLFALAQHFDNKSHAKVGAPQDPAGVNETEQGTNQLGAELSQLSLSSSSPSS